MSDSGALRRLPAEPSVEFLRKQAKRRARAAGLQLATAQRAIAREYGYPDWAALTRAVEELRASALGCASMRGDLDEVRRLLAAGATVDGDPGERDTPLFRACESDASPDMRLAIARVLIDAGAFVRCGCRNGDTPLHAAARRGPASLVQLLLSHGSLAWQPNDKGEIAYEFAKRGRPLERPEVMALLSDRPQIADPDFRDAVAAVQAGDLAALGIVLDRNPDLLRERAIELHRGQRGYFSDPKLFWFVANNPTLVPQSPDNIVEVAKLLIARGVAKEDLDYTLMLVMTNGSMPREQQLALVDTLVHAGARSNPEHILLVLGHGQRDAANRLLERKVMPLTPAVAAGLGQTDALPELLASASPGEVSDALAMAVINGEHEAARLCLMAGADPNRFMPCHTHSTPMHHAALSGDVAMLKLLVGNGANTDAIDTLWRGTPLGWAMHNGQSEAVAYLQSVTAADGT